MAKDLPDAPGRGLAAGERPTCFGYKTRRGNRRWLIKFVDKLYIRSLPILGLDVAAIYLYRYGHVMNWVETLGVIGTVTFSILFWMMLEFSLKIIRQIRGARVEIAKLRKMGVELRNFGQLKITDQATYDKGFADTIQWEKDVVALS